MKMHPNRFCRLYLILLCAPPLTFMNSKESEYNSFSSESCRCNVAKHFFFVNHKKCLKTNFNRICIFTSLSYVLSCLYLCITLVKYSSKFQTYIYLYNFWFLFFSYVFLSFFLFFISSFCFHSLCVNGLSLCL